MKWVWQLENWPVFEYNENIAKETESVFLQNTGKIAGSISHLGKENVEKLKVELLSQEAISTSKIEGEILNRESVQSSVRKHLGLKTEFRKVAPNESGVAEMMVDLYKNFDTRLSHKLIYKWHEMLMNGRRDVEYIGAYRKHDEPMQIVSNNYNKQEVFYEAPPSSQVFDQMERFINWYNSNLTDSSLPILKFAGITHLYFEMIHPFEDGNGRIGRALAEKAISQRLKMPSLNSLSKVIDLEKKNYYESIQLCNNNLIINKYLEYFANLVLKSQEYSIATIGFVFFKARFFDYFNNKLNLRQEKVLLRIFEEGIDGFKGGLSAGNYKSISGASNATATRDLQELVQINALNKTGELKHTRYFLNQNI